MNKKYGIFYRRHGKFTGPIFKFTTDVQVAAESICRSTRRSCKARSKIMEFTGKCWKNKQETTYVK